MNWFRKTADGTILQPPKNKSRLYNKQNIEQNHTTVLEKI
jgi:hypothetical protein